MIDEKQIRKLAHLVRINVDEKDIELFSRQITDVMKVIEDLKNVDTKSVEPLANVMHENMILREDEVNDGNIVDQVTGNSKKTHFNFFVVPKVVE